MKSTTRKRVTRLLTSALLSGDFSRNEVEEIAIALQRGDLASDIGRMFRDLSWRIEIESDAKVPPDESEYSSERAQHLADIAYDVVQRRRMSRDDLLQIIGRVDPNARFALKNLKAPVRQILLLFLADVPQNKLSKFFDLLGISFSDEPQTDRYLDAISNRESR